MDRQRTRLRRLLLGISPREATFERRGFRRGEAHAQAILEQAGATFLAGYHLALEERDPASLAARLDDIDGAWRGFAYEGAAMGLALLDLLLPGRRLRPFLEGPAAPHRYMVHVGAGWAPARLHRRLDRLMAGLDPLLCWLAADGYGFHEGYFHPERTIRRQVRPRGLTGYALRAADQGLGRSLWFVEGADGPAVERAIRPFPHERQADLWSGVGLACAYAGGADRAAVERLAALAGPFRPQLAQGAAFAAQARRHAGSPAAHTATACEVLCGTSADAAADATLEALRGLPPDADVPAYEAWRQRIQAHFAGRPAALRPDAPALALRP